jgi:uncharacterized membrane protein
MSTASNRLFRLYQRITGSIAFYPALIAVGLAALCVVTIYLEMTWLQSYKENLELGLVKNADNARLILGTLVAGTFSLTVFSFTMVMVVLNSAASSLSPRVLPGLISSHNHQVVLGVYLGTIITSLMLISTIQEGDDINVPSLGIFLALALGILCLCLFVFFIRTISLSIQVDFILNRLYKETLHRLRERQAKFTDREPLCWPDDNDWPVTQARRSGYMKALNLAAVHELLDEHELCMTVQVHHGFFVMPGHPLFRLDREVDEAVTDKLLDCFDFYVEEYVNRHFFFGFKQISEIAVKALSPGINDPGTAIKAIDMLCVLFGERLRVQDFDVELRDGKPPRLFLHELSLHEMLYMTLAPLRSYGQADAQVLLALLQAYKNLLFCEPDAAAEAVICRHAQAVIRQGDASLARQLDRDELDQAVQRFNEALRTHPALTRINRRES